MRFPLLVAAAALLMPISAVHAVEAVTPVEPPTDPEPWIADFEGIDIDLRDGWDGAKACLTDGVTTECFDTEAEMVVAAGNVAAAASPAPAGAGFRRASCPSFLRLYTGTNYTGNVLGLSTQFTVMSLSSYGFNNVTSSYRVGACDSAMWDLSAAGAPLYGGNTSAWVSASTMLPGWDNRVSSVFIG